MEEPNLGVNLVIGTSIINGNYDWFDKLEGSEDPSIHCIIGGRNGYSMLLCFI